MTAIGIGMSDRDPIVGWEAINKTARARKPDLYASVRALLDMVWSRQLEVASQVETCTDDEERVSLIERSNSYLRIAQSLQEQMVLHRQLVDEMNREVEQRR